MSDGLHIRWRETPPDRGLLAFALAEIDLLHSTWPETLECNIVIGRASAGEGGDRRFRADVELELDRKSPPLRAQALSDDAYGALRRAFGDLRGCMPPYSGSDVAA